ncbi:MAG: hypothetical protein LC808_01170 [Actinobacteria bacterium]|nr:hypothetical protein [Actinomycetota bacterium]
MAPGDLPVVPVEIDLGDPLSRLAVTCAELRARGVSTALVLIRLHTHPLGLMVLDTDGERSSRACAQAVRAALGEAVDTHLAMDGLGPTDLLKTDGFPAPTPRPACTGAWRRCSRRRWLKSSSPPATGRKASRPAWLAAAAGLSALRDHRRRQRP